MNPAPEIDWNALRAVHDHFRDVGFLCVAEGEAYPQFFAVQANAEGRITHLGAMPQIIEFMADEAGKEKFARMLPQLVGDTPMHRSLSEAMGFEPNVFVQVAEAWVGYELKDGETYDVPPCDQPNRREALVVILHTQASSVVVPHMIETQPTRHAVAHPFPQPGGPESWSGRFTMQQALGAQGTRQ